MYIPLFIPELFNSTVIVATSNTAATAVLIKQCHTCQEGKSQGAIIIGCRVHAIASSKLILLYLLLILLLQ